MTTSANDSRRKTAIHLSDYTQTPYSIAKVDLTFKLSSHATEVVAQLAFEPRMDTEACTPVTLSGDDLTFIGLALDGVELSPDAFKVTPSQLTLFEAPADPFTLTITTEVNPAANKQLMGLYRSGSAYCTQCEAEGFRRITYYYDRPDVLSIFTVRIEADKTDAPKLLSNGNLVESGDLEDGRHFAVWHDPHPKPSYLFALVAGDLALVQDSFTTASGRKVALEIYVEHGNEDKCAYAMDALKRSMRWDEERFGREYDLDVFMIVAVSDFNMGAMENKGLNVFNDKYVLADPEIATDQDYAGVERVIAHEYFHNWTGNRITCRDWFQLCLKEGLTVYRDQEFVSDERSRAVQRIGDVKSLRARQFPEDQGPLAHAVRPRQYEEIDNFYTATVYQKGAEVVRMLATLLGEDGFRAGMDLYFERHDGEATTIEAFLACFEEVAVEDLSQFAEWYHQAGTPRVRVDEKVLSGGLREITLEQSYMPLAHLPDKRPALVIPLRYGFVNGQGEDVERGLITLRQKQKTITLDGIPPDARLSLNRNFSAPIQLDQSQSPFDQLFIAGKDTDPFNRWQAVQDLAMDALSAVYHVAIEGQKPVPPRELTQALGAVLKDETLDASFKALCLTLPAASDVAADLDGEIYPDALANAVAYVRAFVGLSLQDDLRATYDKNHRPGDKDVGAEAAACRALKNACLGLLIATDSDEIAALAALQVKAAANMTDRMGALTSLCRHGRIERAEGLVAMYEAFSDVGLVMDKWLMLQALTNSDDTLSTVRALLHDPVFSMNNPNRVRSLIGGFAANFEQFNRMDGGGYRFLTEQVGKLDAFNPQIAARLLEAMRSWRKLEGGRQALAKSSLEKLADTRGLSSNVSDIVSRLLG